MKKELIVSKDNELAVFNLLSEVNLNIYELSHQEAFALSGFMIQALNGALPVKKEKIDGLTFYEFDYAFYKRIWRFKSISALKLTMRSLCGYLPKNTSTILQPHLIQFVETGKDGIRRAYFALNPNAMANAIKWNHLSGLKQKRLADTIGPKMNIKDLPFQKKQIEMKHPFNNEVRVIYDRLKTIDSLFSTKPPIDEYHYTSRLNNLRMILEALYSGTFTTRYLDRLDLKWFINKNEGLIPDNYKDIILAVKGNWSKISNLLYKSAKNYISWFEPNKLPENKNFLTKDISEWLYSPHGAQSLFIACLQSKQFPMKEASAERIYNSIDSIIVPLADRINQESFDNKVFWGKIKSLDNWYDCNANDLIAQDNNCLYLFDGDKADWFNNYIEFLKEISGNDIKIGHLGIGNDTFDYYCKAKEQYHNLQLYLPRK
jgi:hypothetical protein